jgi:acyl-CoA thioester hydrolase
MDARGRFRRLRRVRPRDIDELGHVNNVAWVCFVVELAGAHSEAVGAGADWLRARGAWWIVRRHAIGYRAAAFPDEELVEETWVRAMRGARCERESRFTRAADGALLVEATTEWAYVDAATQRPRRIPPELFAAHPPLGDD